MKLGQLVLRLCGSTLLFTTTVMGCHEGEPFQGLPDAGAAETALFLDAISVPNVLEDWEAEAAPFLWETHTPGGGWQQISNLGAPLLSLRGLSQRALHIKDLTSNQGLHVRGHAHPTFPANATIKFWARTGLHNPERLIFAVTGAVNLSLSEAHAQERTFMGREVIVLPQWGQIEIALSELVPLGQGAPEPLFSNNIVMLHFVTYPETFDFWIDDIELHCPGGC